MLTTDVLFIALASLVVGWAQTKLVSGPISRIDPDLADFPCHTPDLPKWLPPVLITASLIAAVAVWSTATPGWPTISLMLYAWALVFAAAIDLRFMLLPDRVTLPLLWAGLLANLYGGATPLPDAVLGAAAGYLSLWGIYQLTLRIFQKEGMGYGDFKLFAAIGAWQGYTALPTVLLIACGVQILVVAAWPRYRQFNIPLPFGPCLAFGALSVVAFGTMV